MLGDSICHCAFWYDCKLAHQFKISIYYDSYPVKLAEIRVCNLSLCIHSTTHQETQNIECNKNNPACVIYTLVFREILALRLPSSDLHSALCITF